MLTTQAVLSVPTINSLFSSCVSDVRPDNLTWLCNTFSDNFLEVKSGSSSTTSRSYPKLDLQRTCRTTTKWIPPSASSHPINGIFK